MNNETSQLSFSQSLDITLSKPDGILAIGKRDWNRLKRTVKKCKPQTEWWSVVASFAFGVCASAFVSIITIKCDSTEYNKAVLPVLYCVTIFSGIIGFISIYFHKSESSHYSMRLENVTEVINDIEQTFDQVTVEAEKDGDVIASVSGH